MLLNNFLNAVTFLIFILTTAGGILDKSKHQTNASMEKTNNLTCFECDSITSGENCTNLNLHNKTKFHAKCDGMNKTCMVQKYSYTTSTENFTSQIRMWALKRNCTEKCEEGCIIIGERTKLHACTACCKDNLCNVTNAALFLRCKILLFSILVAISIGKGKL